LDFMNANFMNIEGKYAAAGNAAYTVIPVPYDATSSWNKGADKGPEALILASGQVEYFDIETNSEPYVRGIHTARQVFDFSTPQAMVESVQQRIAGVFAGSSLPVVLGGEHSVSIGAIRAVAAACKDLTVLQLDAHADLRDEYHGSRYNHACVMARAGELCPILQVGIRSGDISEFDEKTRSRILFAQDIVGKTNWIDSALAKLSGNVYITIDLDVFDPSIMPSTGTPEPGGLLWYPVLSFLRAVIESRNCVGFDVVELCPNGMPHAEYLAAKLVYKLMAYHSAAGKPNVRIV
jgi:agmatinase